MMCDGRKDAAVGAARFAPQPFRPAWWLPGAHGQTIAGRLLRRPPVPPLARERIDTPDGDFVDLDFMPPGRNGEPIVLVLHGLEGSSRRGYALLTYAALARRGMRAVGMNFRSCGGELNRAARLYHSGETEDLRLVMHHLRERFPTSPIGAIGFSLGGNVLLKYLGEEGERAEVRAAVAISVPYDLAAGARALERSAMGRFYTRVFLESLIAKALVKAQLLGERCDEDRIRSARTFHEFDDAATAPIHGFASANDYYARSSSAAYLDRIHVDVLLLHARDDPFLPAAALPSEAIRRNPRLTAVVTENGGHVGFLAGPPWALRYWAEEEGARYLGERLLDGAHASR